MHAPPGFTIPDRQGFGPIYVLKGADTVNELGYRSDATDWAWAQHLGLANCIQCDTVPSTHHDMPPVPVRDWDWQIHCGNCQAGEPVPAFGATAEAAAADWARHQHEDGGAA